jgi:hypothetical protein
MVTTGAEILYDLFEEDFLKQERVRTEIHFKTGTLLFET